MLSVYELLQAKGKATAAVQEMIDKWVKTRGETNARGNLRHAGFDTKTIDKVIDAAVEKIKAEAQEEAEAQAKADAKAKKSKNK